MSTRSISFTRDWDKRLVWIRVADGNTPVDSCVMPKDLVPYYIIRIALDGFDLINEGLKVRDFYELQQSIQRAHKKHLNNPDYLALLSGLKDEIDERVEVYRQQRMRGKTGGYRIS